MLLYNDATEGVWRRRMGPWRHTCLLTPVCAVVVCAGEHLRDQHGAHPYGLLPAARRAPPLPAADARVRVGQGPGHPGQLPHPAGLLAQVLLEPRARLRQPGVLLRHFVLGVARAGGPAVRPGGRRVLPLLPPAVREPVCLVELVELGLPVQQDDIQPFVEGAGDGV
eukprot:354411-Prorocentrum_minimum.AAC.1